MATVRGKTGVQRRFGMLLLCVAVLVGALVLATGAQGTTEVSAQLSPQITITVDGSTQVFYNASGSEVHPIAYQGTTYLPLRAVGELMGKNVNWDQSTLTVTLAGKRTTGAVAGTPDTDARQQRITAQLRPDFTIIVDGSKRSFTDANGNAVYPLLYSGSTYLPLRAVGELMGKQVSWNSATSTVALSGGNLVTDADSFQQGSDTPATPTTSPSSGLISVEDAKAKALAHAGLSANQVTFARQHLDWEDGRQVYEVEFYTSDNREYDYEIDAKTGAVISFDYDAEHYNSNPSNTGSYIGEQKAKSIALAQVSGATESNVVKVSLDMDDGRAQYEVKIVKGTMEYDFEIDAATGTISDQEAESIYD